MAARFDDGGPLMRRTRGLQFIGSRVQIVMSSESSWEFGIRSVTGQVTGILSSSDRRLPFYEVSLTEPAAVEELRRDGVSTDSLTGIKSVAVQGANVGSNPEDIISSPQTEILVDVVRIGGTSKERRLPSLRRSTSPDYLGYGQLRLVDSDSMNRMDLPDGSGRSEQRELLVYAFTVMAFAVVIAWAYAIFFVPILYSRFDWSWVAVSLLVTLLGTLSLLADFCESVLGLDSSNRHSAVMNLGFLVMIAAVIIGLGSVAFFGFYDGIRLALLSGAQAGIWAVLVTLPILVYRFLRRFRDVGMRV